MGYLRLVKHCARQLTYVTSFVSQNNFTRWVEAIPKTNEQLKYSSRCLLLGDMSKLNHDMERCW